MLLDNSVVFQVKQLLSWKAEYGVLTWGLHLRVFFPLKGKMPLGDRLCSMKPKTRVVGWDWASLVAQIVKIPPAIRETWVLSQDREDPLEEGLAIQSSILAWRIPMDRGAWPATVLGIVKRGDTTERLSTVAQVRICIQAGRIRQEHFFAENLVEKKKRWTDCQNWWLYQRVALREGPEPTPSSCCQTKKKRHW